ncbi:gamma-butyrobetaine hydroxylase-like domain-containing protein [Mycobacterium simulans]|uniref:gamma-butyrobetaine hydroxylase-like domain-containing protein n=1 Tax=Mycobacterium simulans TaxID=627089 RepID=UPI0016412F3E
MIAAVVGDINQTNRVVFHTDDGRSIEMSAWWLRRQCPCALCRTESGQTTNACNRQRGQTTRTTFASANRKHHMKIRKPHLVVDDHGNIVAANWAPPFEGPFAGAPAVRIRTSPMRSRTALRWGCDCGTAKSSCSTIGA